MAPFFWHPTSVPQNTCGSCGFIGPAGRSYSGALLLILAARTLFANAEGATCSGELSLQRSLPPRSLPYHVLFLPQWVSPALAVFLINLRPSAHSLTVGSSSVTRAPLPIRFKTMSPSRRQSAHGRSQIDVLSIEPPIEEEPSRPKSFSHSTRTKQLSSEGDSQIPTSADSIFSRIASPPPPSNDSPAPASPPSSKPGSPFVERSNPMGSGNAQTVTSKDPKAVAQAATDMKNVVRRKLTGYVGFANLPNQWHRKSVRKGFNFNVMVVGE